MGKFCPTPRNSTIIFCPGGRELDKKFSWVAGIRSLKKNFPGGCLGGMYPVGIDPDITSNPHVVSPHVTARYSQMFFALDSLEVRVSVVIKTLAFKTAQMKGEFFACLGNFKQIECKIQDFFCSHNIQFMFLYKTELRQYLCL